MFKKKNISDKIQSIKDLALDELRNIDLNVIKNYFKHKDREEYFRQKNFGDLNAYIEEDEELELDDNDFSDAEQ